MDLRVVKTRGLIKEAFFELRRKKPLEKITVKELCQRARINKSTFYSHYKDIFDLSDVIENEVVSSILSNVQHPEYVLTKCDAFTRELLSEFTARSDITSTLFSFGRGDILVTKLKRKIKETILQSHPEYENNLSIDIILSYTINGGYHAFNEFSRENQKQAAHIISEINRSLADLYKAADDI